MKHSNLLGRTARPAIRWSAIRAALVGVASAAGAQSAFGFAIEYGYEVHQEITQTAIDAIRPVRLGGVEREFTEDALEAIVEFNRLTDKDLQSMPKAHFDNELIETSWKWIYVNRQRVLFELNKPVPNISQAHKWLGRALHTIQDFYAHSNYVELGHREPVAFGTEQLVAPLTNNAASTGQCNSSGGFFGGSAITTGHWLGGIEAAVDTAGQLVPLYNSAGILRCRHGFPGGVRGLNKDTPGLDGHRDARDLAVRSSTLFIESIVNGPELTGKDAVRCMFLGHRSVDCSDDNNVRVYELSATLVTPRYLNGTRTSTGTQGSTTRPWGTATTSMVFAWAEAPLWHETVCKIGDRWIAQPSAESVAAPSESVVHSDCTGYSNRRTNTLTFALAEDGRIDGTRSLVTETDYTCPNRGVETQLSNTNSSEDVAAYDFDLNTGAGSYTSTITASFTARRLGQLVNSSSTSAHGSLTWGAGELIPPLELLRTVPYTGDDQLPAECR